MAKVYAEVIEQNTLLVKVAHEPIHVLFPQPPVIIAQDEVFTIVDELGFGTSTIISQRAVTQGIIDNTSLEEAEW